MTQTLLLGLALAVSAPALKGRPKDRPPPIEGEWKLVEWLQGGAETRFWDGTGVEFQADGVRVWRDGPGPAEARGYKLHPKTTPAAIDLIRPAGDGPPDVFPSVYKVDGDTLVICVGDIGGERPTQFESPKGTGQMLMTFKRVPKKKE